MASVCASVVALPVAAAHVVAAPKRGSLAPMPLAKVDNQWKAKTVSNGVTTTAMLVWQPENNKFFETLSFLPPLSNAEIGKQIDYITNNGWIPCLEFADAKQSYVDSASTIRMGNCGSNYYDNRYWTMYKLPMFGCTDSSVVIKEIGNCIKSFPDAYIRIVAFDNLRQVQCAGFLVHRPKTANDFRAPSERSA